jgi:hypothetical protein
MDKKVTKSWVSAFGVFQVGRNDKIPQIKCLETAIPERCSIKLCQIIEPK